MADPTFVVSQEGTHTLTVVTQSESGAETAKTIHFSLDKTAPVANLGIGVRTIYRNDELILDASPSSDNMGIALYQWTIAGDTTVYTGKVFKKTFTTVGDYNIELKVQDTHGNWCTTPATVLLHVYHRPVEVTFAGATNNQKFNQPVKVQINAVDGAIKTVKLNGQTIAGTEINAANDGAYQVEVYAVNVVDEERVFRLNFSIDQTPPVAVIDRSIAIQGFNDNKPVTFVAGNCTDNTEVTQYIWSFSDSDQLYPGKSIARGFTQAGEYVAILKVTDAYGNVSTPDYLKFTVKDKGSTAIQVSGIVDQGNYNQAVAINVTVTGGTLQRIVLDNQLQTGAPINVTGEGVHYLKVEASNDQGYTTVQTYKFTIDTTPPVALLPAIWELAEGETLTLSGKGSDLYPITGYKWAFSGESQEYEGNPLVKAGLAIGEYSAKLWVKDNCGNWSTTPAIATVRVRARPVEFKIAGVSPNTYNNQDVMIQVTANYGSITGLKLNGKTYTDGTSVTAEGRYTFEFAGVNKAGEVSSGSLVFNIDRTPPTAEAGADRKCFNDGSRIAFDGRASLDNLGVAKFEWTFSDGQKLNGPIAYRGFTQVGTYTVTLVVTDMAGNRSVADTCQVLVADMGNTRFDLAGIIDNGRYIADVPVQVGVTGGRLQKFTIDNIAVEGNVATITVDGKHQIYLEAINDNGYLLTRTYTVWIDKTPPLADTGGDRRTFTGQPIILEGGYSSDKNGIAEYQWTFSDGAVSSGRQAQKTFNYPGTYYVDLKVKDSYGNWSAYANRATIEVRDPGKLSVLNTIVKDTANKPLPSAIVVIEDAAGQKIKLSTDYQGMAGELVDAGTYKVYAYRPGCKSQVKEVAVSNLATQEVYFALETGTDVVALTESRQLDLNEIKALGIDTTAPENRFVFKYSFTVAYEEVPIKIEMIKSLDKEILIEDGGVERELGEGMEIDFPEPRVCVITMLGTAGVLKEFHELAVTIINGADSAVTFDNTQLHLNLPDGLSLASIPSENLTDNGNVIRTQNLDVNAGSIPGQSQKKILWVLRGDEPGSYSPTIDYSGVLNPFETVIKDTTQLKEPIKIADPTKLTLKGSAPDIIHANEYFTMLLEFENQADKPFYDAILTVDKIEIGDPSMIRLVSDLSTLKVQKDCLQPGEKISLSVQFYSYIEGVCTFKELKEIEGGNVSFGTQVLPDCPRVFSITTDDKEVMLEWLAPADYFSYIIKRRKLGETEFRVIGPESYGEWYRDTEVENFQTYEYVVSTVNFEGVESIMSEVLRATPGKITATPASGRKEEPVEVTLSAGTTPNAVIYYTTDGSDPVPNQSAVYQGPILVNKSQMIKAVAVNGQNVSTVYPFTYVIGNVLQGDFVDGNWHILGSKTVTRENQGSQYGITLPATELFDWQEGMPPAYLKEMPQGNWIAETLVKLEQFTDGTQFASGMLITVGDQVSSWGYYKGTNLCLLDKGQTYSTGLLKTFGSTMVYLRVRKEGNYLYYEYRGSREEGWQLGGSRQLFGESVLAGVYARTWTTPRLVKVGFTGFKVTGLPALESAWEWRQPVSGPDYHVLSSNALTITVPDTRIYNQTRTSDSAPKLVRNDIYTDNWVFSATQEIVSNSGSTYFSGMVVDFGAGERLYWGREGDQLVVRRTTGGIIYSTAIAVPVKLQLERQGTTFRFNYRGLNDTVWVPATATDILSPALELGLMTRTWSTAQRISATYRNIEWRQTVQQLGPEWYWQSGTPGTAMQSVTNGVKLAVSDQTYYDDSTTEHLVSRLVRDCENGNWQLEAKVTTGGTGEYLAGLQTILSDAVWMLGLKSGGVKVSRNNEVIAEISGVAGAVYLRQRKMEQELIFEYRVAATDSWQEVKRITLGTHPVKVALAVKTFAPVMLDAAFTQVKYTRLLPGVWEWYVPLTGPVYTLDPDQQLEVTVPGDKAYVFNSTIDQAPQLRTDLNQLPGDWTLSTTATLKEYISGGKFQSGLMVYFSPTQILRWGFYNGLGLKGYWNTMGLGPVVNTNPAVQLQIRKVGSVYYLEYRYSEGETWQLAGKTTITLNPVKAGWLSQSSAANRVVTLVKLPELVETIPEYPVTIKVTNQRSGLAVSQPAVLIDQKAVYQTAEGFVSLLKQGTHTVKVNAPGYNGALQTIEVTGAATLTVPLAPVVATPEVAIVFVNPLYDSLTSQLLVGTMLQNSGTDAKLWVRMTVVDQSAKVAGILKGEVIAASRSEVYLNPQEWIFRLSTEPAQLKVEIYEGNETGVPLTTREFDLNL